jgi:ribonuclease HII
VTVYRVGADEVGYGAWAGCVAVGVVAWPRQRVLEGLRDSKEYTGKTAHRRRLAIAEEIARDHDTHYVVEGTSHEVINKIGMGPALKLTFKTAIEKILELPIEIEQITVDGDMRAYELVPVGVKAPFRSLVGADGLLPEVMAASVIAKVSRDILMIEASKKYPAYGFQDNKGYGTKHHELAIMERGPCEIHRLKPISSVMGAKQFGLPRHRA